jgi:WD40 repeat protein
MTKVIKADTDKIRDDTAAMKRDTAQILQEIVKLKGELEEKLPNTGSLFIMQRFLGSLTTYAESSRGDGSTGEMGEELHIPTQLEHYIPPIGFLDSSQSGSSPTLASQTHYDAMSISTPSLSQASSLLDIEIIMPPDLSLLSFDDLEKKSNSGVPKFQGVADPFTISDLQYFTEGHADLVYALCRVGSLVISGSRDTSIRIWDTRSGRLRHQPLSGHRGSVHCVIADETRDLLVSGDNKGRIISWKLSTGALQQDFPKAHESCVVGVALNKRYLVSASHDRTAKVWDRNTLLAHEEGGKSDISPKKVLRCHTSAILALVLTEEKAITAGNDCRIRVFDLDSGACLKTISSHKNFIATLALCQDKRHVISAGEDRYILIHDIESGDLVAKLEGGHRDIVRTLLVVPSSTIFISGSYDETVVIWAQNEDGNWKQERVLDVPKAQRSLGLDKLVRQRGYDLTESLRNAAEAGKDAGVFSDSKVFALCSNGRQILCGAGSTILGWDFDDTAVSGIGSRTRNVSPRAFSTTFEGKEAG